MSSTYNVSRSLGVENESRLSGSEAIEAEGGVRIDQTVSAGTEEQLAMAGFKDTQMQAMCLVADQALEMMFLGERYALVTSAAGPPGVLTHLGDLEQEIFANDLVRVEGTVGNDGIYLVETVAEVIGTTTITFENGEAMVGGEGAVGTVARIASHKLLSYAYPVTSTTLGTGAIVITGNVSDVFAAGDHLTLQDTVTNDGLWLVMSVTTDGPPVTITTIVVSDANLAVPVAGLPATEGAIGHISLCRPAILLAANVPFLWTREGGLPNPFWQAIDLVMAELPQFNEFRGDVAFCMANCAGAVNAVVKGRIGIEPIIF